MELDKLILKLYKEEQRAMIIKMNLKRNEIEGFALVDFQFSYMAIVIKIMFSDSYREINYWNKIENPETN